jgi:3-hydroxyacyl-CoA dehydrogenase
MLNENFKNISVIGAAGKMGSGISLLLLQEMARIEAEQTGAIGQGKFRLLLIDENFASLNNLKPYFRTHLLRYAEKNINKLRTYFKSNPTLISNKEVITYFVENTLNLILYDHNLDRMGHASLVFESVVEDVDIKCKVLEAAAKSVPKETLFFSNTSSIPIHILNTKSRLDNRIIGFHFYNPPAVQKLVELVIPRETVPLAANVATELANRLNKVIVRSQDIAGFIGNGHFIREIAFACKKVSELSRFYTLNEAIYAINRVTQDFLIRPMGIFQLMDYVGVDVCQKICRIMSTYLPGELFQEAFIDDLVSHGILGGQNSNGSQKNGIFQYDTHGRIAIYNPSEDTYSPLHQPWVVEVDKRLGDFPAGHMGWKQMQQQLDYKEKLSLYFDHLMHSPTQGADLAKEFLINSHHIATNLVKQGVAKNMQDVDTILEMGFFHLYGPGSPCLHLEAASR